MRKIIIILLIFVAFIPVYSQNQYSIRVHAIWGTSFTTQINYSGDYTGTGTTSFTIGPYDTPFTVTLEIVEPSENAFGTNLAFTCWDLICPDSNPAVSVTAGEANPQITVVAEYISIEPTPSVIIDGGDVSLYPGTKRVNVSEAFTWEIYANTGVQRLAAFDFDLSWPVPQDGVIMYVDTSKGSDGVEPGIDTDGFILSASADNASGSLSILGFDTEGTVPGTYLHICTIHFIAGSWPVLSASVNLEVLSMTDENTNTIGVPGGSGGVIQIDDMDLGDVDEDGMINIVDALLAAQHYVGLNPPAYTASVEKGDANQDRAVDIVDALMIAQYYVGICQCPYFPPL